MTMTHEKFCRQFAVMMDSMLLQIDPKGEDPRWDDQRWVIDNYIKWNAKQPPSMSASEKVRQAFSKGKCKCHEEETE